MRYTVVEKRTGLVICEEATTGEAMRAIGLKSRWVFYSTVSRARTGGEQAVVDKKNRGKGVHGV